MISKKVIGITGLIGTGKTTVSQILEDFGAKVHDADKTVHKLYDDNDVLREISQHFEYVDLDNFDRNALMESLKAYPERRAKLESIIHPKVRESQLDFLSDCAELCVLDVPLLYETNAHELCDEVWVTHCHIDTQRKRVLARDGFDEEKFQTIMAWQGDDAWKRDKATHIIDTDKSIAALEQHVRTLLG